MLAPTLFPPAPKPRTYLEPRPQCLITTTRPSRPRMPVRLQLQLTAHGCWGPWSQPVVQTTRPALLKQAAAAGVPHCCPEQTSGGWALKAGPSPGCYSPLAHAGASLTYPQQAGTIRKNGYIVINNRPCKASCAPRMPHGSTHWAPEARQAAANSKQCRAAAEALAHLCAGRGRVHVQDRQARSRQVPLRGRGHLHEQEV